MGRWSYSNKTEADYLRKVTIYELNKPGLLRGYKSYKEKTFWWKSNFSIDAGICTMAGDEFVIFYYALTLPNGGTKDIKHRFPLTTTPCNLGGERYWFICSPMQNGNRCGRRVGVLYLSPKNMEFACRHCLALTYSSRKLSGRFKAGGNIISIPDLERAGNTVKRKFYNGEITRKYARYLKMGRRAERTWAAYLGTVIKIKDEREARMMRSVPPNVRRKFYKLRQK